MLYLSHFIFKMLKLYENVHDCLFWDVHLCSRRSIRAGNFFRRHPLSLTRVGFKFLPTTISELSTHSNWAGPRLQPQSPVPSNGWPSSATAAGLPHIPLAPAFTGIRDVVIAAAEVIFQIWNGRFHGRYFFSLCWGHRRTLQLPLTERFVTSEMLE